MGVENEKKSTIPEQVTRLEPNGSVLSTGDFLRDFELESKHARVLGSQVMLIEATKNDESEEGDAASVLRIYQEAPTTAQKRLTIDDFTLLAPQGRTYSIGTRTWEAEEVKMLRQRALDRVAAFKQTGAEVTIHNQAKDWKERFLPLTGRDHIKGTFVDKGKDKVFYLHTSNHHDRLGYSDLAIKFTGDVASRLIEEWLRINSDDAPKEDYSVKIADDIELFVDAGRPGKSIILDKGLQLIGNSGHVRLCSYLYPDGKLPEALQEVKNKRGYSSVITSHWTPEPTQPSNLANIVWVANEAAKLSARLHGYSFPVVEHPYSHMHAKLATGILKDEHRTKWAYVGSHNLSQKGVKAGTKEWQLLITDPRIVEGLNRWIDDRYMEIKYEKLGTK